MNRVCAGCPASGRGLELAHLRIGVIGAGVIGRTHLDTIARVPGFALAGLVEPGPEGAALAENHGAPLLADVAAMVAERPDGVVVATPNETHVEITLALVGAGIPVLLEKPVASSVAEAASLRAFLRGCDVPVLVGHHRRHNPIIQAARRHVSGGAFGRLVLASVTCALLKPTSYFGAGWRSQPGVGGPMLINLIHEVDLMRHLFGEVASVTALAHNRERGQGVEDTAGVVVAFRDGGLATFAISDAAAGPWAWDLTAGENLARFPSHATVSHLLAGTRGGLSLPDLAVWMHRGEPRWETEMERHVIQVEKADSYERQLIHFGDVVTGRDVPVCPVEDALRSLAVIEAAAASARHGRAVTLARDGLGEARPTGDDA